MSTWSSIRWRSPPRTPGPFPAEEEQPGLMRSIRDKTSTTWRGLSDTFRRSTRGLFRPAKCSEDGIAQPSTPADRQRNGHGRRGSIFSLFSSPSPTKSVSSALSPIRTRQQQRRTSVLDKLNTLSRKHKPQPVLDVDQRLVKGLHKRSVMSLDRLRFYKQNRESTPEPAVPDDDQSSYRESVDASIEEFDRLSNNAPQVREHIPSYKLDTIPYRVSIELQRRAAQYGITHGAPDMFYQNGPVESSQPRMAWNCYEPASMDPYGAGWSESMAGSGAYPAAPLQTSTRGYPEALATSGEDSVSMLSKLLAADQQARNHGISGRLLSCLTNEQDYGYQGSDCDQLFAEKMSPVDCIGSLEDVSFLDTERKFNAALQRDDSNPKFVEGAEGQAQLVDMKDGALAQSLHGQLRAANSCFEPTIPENSPDASEWQNTRFTCVFPDGSALQSGSASGPSTMIPAWPQSLPEHESDFVQHRLRGLSPLIEVEIGSDSSIPRFSFETDSLFGVHHQPADDNTSDVAECLPLPPASGGQNDKSPTLESENNLHSNTPPLTPVISAAEANSTNASYSTLGGENSVRLDFSSPTFTGVSVLTTASCAVSTDSIDSLMPLPSPEHHRRGETYGPFANDDSGALARMASHNWQEDKGKSAQRYDSDRQIEPTPDRSDSRMVPDTADDHFSMQTPTPAGSLPSAANRIGAPPPSRCSSQYSTPQKTLPGSFLDSPRRSSEIPKAAYSSAPVTDGPRRSSAIPKTCPAVADVSPKRSLPQTSTPTSRGSPSKLPKLSSPSKKSTATPPSRIATPATQSGKSRTNTGSIGAKQGRRSPNHTPTPTPFAERKTSIPSLSSGNKFYSKVPSLTQHRHTSCTAPKDEAEFNNDMSMSDWAPKRASPLTKRQSRASLRSVKKSPSPVNK